MEPKNPIPSQKKALKLGFAFVCIMINLAISKSRGNFKLSSEMNAAPNLEEKSTDVHNLWSLSVISFDGRFS